jgi:hypothetical protein
LIRGQREEIRAAEERASKFAVQAELTNALAAQPLVPAARTQLAQLWAGELTADPTANGFNVRAKTTYEPVAKFVSDRLKQTEYAHYLAGQQSSPAPTASKATPHVELSGEPKTLGHDIIQRFQARQGANSGQGGTELIEDGRGGVRARPLPAAAMFLKPKH